MAYTPTGNTNGVTGTVLHKSRTPATSWQELPLVVDGTIEQVYRYRDRLAIYYTKDSRLHLGLSNPDNTVTHITQILDLSVPVQWFTSAHGHLAHQDFDALFVNVEYKVSTETRRELRCIRIKDGVLVNPVTVAVTDITYIENRQKFALSDPQHGTLVLVGGVGSDNKGTRTIVYHRNISPMGVFHTSSKTNLDEEVQPGCDVVVFKDRRSPDVPIFDVCIIGGGESASQFRSRQLYCVKVNTSMNTSSVPVYYLDAWTCSTTKPVNGADRIGDMIYWVDIGMVGTLTTTGFGPSGVRFDQAWIKRYDLFRKSTFSVKRMDKRIVESSLCVDEHGVSIYPSKVNEYINHSPFDWTYIPTDGKIQRINHPDRVALSLPASFKGTPRTIKTNDNEGSRVVERFGYEYDPTTNTMTLRYNQRSW